jgi:hypothetical protein
MGVLAPASVASCQREDAIFAFYEIKNHVRRLAVAGTKLVEIREIHRAPF